MSDCPDFPHRCGAPSPMQRTISEGEALQLDEPRFSQARVCTYCGLIYTKRWGRVARGGHVTDAAGHGLRRVAAGHWGTYA